MTDTKRLRAHVEATECGGTVYVLYGDIVALLDENERLRGKLESSLDTSEAVDRDLTACKTQLSAALAEVEQAALHRARAREVIEDLKQQLAAALAEVERLRVIVDLDVLGLARKERDDLHAVTVQLEQQLTLALAAKDEACDVLHDIGSHDDEYGFAVDTAAELRAVGK